MIKKRDLKADLELFNKATPGHAYAKERIGNPVDRVKDYRGGETRPPLKEERT